MEAKLKIGTVVEIVKKVEGWGVNVSWPTVDYDLIGKLAIITKNDKVEQYGYKTRVQNNEEFWFPEESLEVLENQDILFLRIIGNKPAIIFIYNTAKYLLNKETDDHFVFASKSDAEKYIEENYDKISGQDS